MTKIPESDSNKDVRRVEPVPPVLTIDDKPREDPLVKQEGEQENKKVEASVTQRMFNHLQELALSRYQQQGTQQEFLALSEDHFNLVINDEAFDAEKREQVIVWKKKLGIS